MELSQVGFRGSVSAANHHSTIVVTLSDLEQARLVQRQLLPRKLPCPPGWDIAVAYLPARVVSGDYCDVIDLGGGLIAFALGDVSGKGLGPALVMAGLRALIHSRLPQQRTNLAALMRELNLYLLATMPDDMFVTLFLAVLDVSTGQIHYVNAGHLPPLVLAGPDAEPMRFTISGPVLGILPDIHFETNTVGIEPGSLLAVFSDGVTEATDASGKMFYQSRVVESLQKGWSSSATHQLAHLLQSVERFSKNVDQADDISVILIRRSR
jgi:sigma-B regulation protein RsbU (phosphoserine phosphatase)